MKSGRANLATWICFLALGVCFTFLPPSARAGTAPDFPLDFSSRAWTKQQGLPDDSVTSVLQTRDGYLWVGTSGGLARFDGMKFTTMSPPGWKSNAPVAITALCEDSEDRLWIGTQDYGLLRYEDGVVRLYSADRAYHFRTINSIAEGSNRELWVGTPTGLVRLRDGESRRFTKTDGLPNDFISNVHLARSGTLWITTRGGMCQFTNEHIETVPFQTEGPGRNPESLGVYEDRSGDLWAYGDTYLVNLKDGKHLNHFGSGDAASTRMWTLCEGRNGELWIGASGKGLYCFVRRSAKNADEHFLPLTIHPELTSDVRAICQDRQGNLWLGTHGDGLVRLQPRIVRALDAGVGLPSRSPVCLAFNSQGRAWIGFDRAGLYAGTTAGFEPFPNKSLPTLQNLVSSVSVTPDSSVWVGTPGAGLYCVTKDRCLHLTTADGLSDNTILSVAVDSAEAIWVGTSAGLDRIANGTATHFGAADGIPEEPVTAILAGRNGGVWLGFSNGAVFRENRGQFHLASQSSTTQNRAVRALWEDLPDRLWIGTEGGHIGCINGERFVSWDLPSGSVDKSILGIVTEDGDLWIETDKSIYCVARNAVNGWLSGQASLTLQQVFRADSVPGAGPGFGWPRAVKSPNGTLWFAMGTGVVAVDLAGASIDVSPPPVVIEDVIVDKQRLSKAKIKAASGIGTSSHAPIHLPSNVTSLDIDFTALDLTAPEKVQFRHRLEGYEPEWVVDNNIDRHVHYGTLSYGPYTFRLQAGNGDQTWFDTGASFSFVVPTPLWRTSWALATYSLAALALVGGIARVVSARRFRRRLAVLAAQQAMERERMRIARDMHDEIGSKLTKISFMSERAKRELEGQDPVARKLDSIAGTSRELLQTLDEIVWAVNPHNDTLEHLAAYLGQYATEYLQNTAVECELHIPRGLPHHPLSAEARHNLFLAFEESLNNALKHGRPSRVRVDMQLAPAQFEIIIEDNGCGFDSDSFAIASGRDEAAFVQNGNGLRNMRQRLEILGGHCRIRSSTGHGTTVTLTVPLAMQAAAKSNGSRS